jgi:long-chain acyl-CoA synthetase
MDSLAKMNLLSSLSADLGVTLQVETLAKHPTARSLAEAIDAGGEAVAAAPPKKYELPKTGWTHGFFRLCMKGFLRCISKPEVTGLENIPAGPCIFAPNHQSSLDAFYLSTAIVERSKPYFELGYSFTNRYISIGMDSRQKW